MGRSSWRLRKKKRPAQLKASKTNRRLINNSPTNHPAASTHKPTERKEKG
jgi:hypothetical protein